MANQFVVVDRENEVVVGPFATSEEATIYFTRLAQSEEWGDVCELIKETGSPFIETMWGDGLYLAKVEPPIADPYLVEPYVEPYPRSQE